MKTELHPQEGDAGEQHVYTVGDYTDEDHAEVLDDLEIGDYGYKYRVLDGLVCPPYITPARYALSRTLAVRDGDICYTSFPKSGSTWLAYIILLVTRGGAPLTERTLRSNLHWVASSWTYPRSSEELESMPPPRVFKSHMPYRMAVGGVPAGNACRYIYIARNPRDVAVSYYYFESRKSWSGNYNGPWEHWLRLFMEGRVQRGDWFDHVLSWWQHRDADNILFLKYEDLKKNFRCELEKIAAFLDYPLTAEKRSAIEEKTSFEAMKSDPLSNMHEIREFDGFFREGRVGSWKEQFTAAQDREFERSYRRRTEGSGLDFEFG